MSGSAIQQSYQRKAAVTAGVSLIIMALCAFFSASYVHESLVIQGDASTTYNNIVSSHALFKAEIFGWLLILITDILVAWAFYVFLEPINKSLALLAAWLRLAYTAILGVAILNLVLALLLSTNTVEGPSFSVEQIQALMMLFFGGFQSIWSIGLIIFGGHLFLVGIVILQSGSIPKAFGLLLFLAAFGYIVIHISETFYGQYEGIIKILNLVFVAPMVAGELGFGIWLLLRGGRVHSTRR